MFVCAAAAASAVLQPKKAAHISTTLPKTQQKPKHSLLLKGCCRCDAVYSNKPYGIMPEASLSIQHHSGSSHAMCVAGRGQQRRQKGEGGRKVCIAKCRGEG